MLLKQSTARSLVVFMTDTSDHIAGKTGLTLTITASKDGGAFASITPTVTELATGWYKLALTSSHTDTLGDLALHITGSGADPTDLVRQVVSLLPGDAVTLQADQAVNVTKVNGTSQTARDLGASVLLSSGTGTGQLDFTSGVVKANATQWLGGTIPAVNVTGGPLVDAKYLLGTVFSTPTVAGVPNVNAKTWNDLTTVALPLVPTTAGRTLDVSTGGEAGLDWANVGSPTTTLALTGTTIATTQKVDIETIKTNPVVNAGTVTFPTTATLASTTNITAGTITTVTNLTNAATSGDLTATMKTSVTTAATAATPTAAAVTGAVGSVTGNVGGNVTGSVGSVVGAVGSVTAAVSLSAGDSPVMQSGTAAAGGASTITIASALGADTLPVGCVIKITSGTGANQARIITAYVNATKVVTVDRAWTTTPDNTSVYSILYAEVPALGSSLKVAGVVLTDTVTTYTGNTVQTGDAYARLGAPAGASVSADVAAVKTDTAAVKVKTDFLPSATAGSAGGVFIAGSNAATSIATALTANVIGNVTGNLSGSVGSVTGNVGGNVVGSVASVTARVTANTDQLAGQTVTAGAGVTFPASVASPTNITAGTITTVTNLTNAPTAGDFTAVMKTSLDAATPAVTVSDKTGFALTAAYDPAKTAAQAGDAMALTSGERTTLAASIWDALTSGLTTVGSIGKLLVDNVNATISSRSSHSASDVWAVATRLLTAGTNIVLAKGTGITGLNDLDAAGVRAAVGLASADLDTQLAALPTAAESADAVWEEAIADHSGTAGSTAEALAAAGSAGDPWTTALPGAYAAGTAGKIVGDNLNATVSSRLPTSSYVTPLDAAGVRTAVGLASANLDTQLDALPTAVENAGATWDEARAGHVAAGSFGQGVASVQGNVTGSTGSVTGAVGSVTGNVGGNVVGTVASVVGAVGSVTGLTASDVGAIKTKTDQFVFGTANRVNAQVFGMEAGTVTAAAIATDAIDADAIKTDAVTEIQSGLSTLDAAGVRTAMGLASANLDTQLGNILTDTAEIGVAGAGLTALGDTRIAHLDADVSSVGGGSLTVQDIVDGVLDEATSGHQTAGTVGKAITDAQSAGDPWASELETGVTASTMLRAAAALAAGKTDITDLGAGAATVVFRDISDASDLIAATMAGSERTAVTVTP